MPPRTSTTSYGDFKQIAWNHYQHHDQGSTEKNIKALYSLYSSYNPGKLAPKVALADKALKTSMVKLIAAVGNREARIQGTTRYTHKGTDYEDKWVQMDKTGLSSFYDPEVSFAPTALQQAQAGRAPRTYLHVYPTGATITRTQTTSGGTTTIRNAVTYPQGRATNNNWRIGLNVIPDDIHLAAQYLCPIMDSNTNINHIKFSPPGMAGKPDSVIIYMRHADDYDTIRNAVNQAVSTNNIRLQATFSPMWNEISSGLAEAAEPPKSGGSFGTYRCFVMAMAYDFMGEFGLDDRDVYESIVDQLMDEYGINTKSPHAQAAIQSKTDYADANKLFMETKALYDGKASDYYTSRNTALTDR